MFDGGDEVAPLFGFGANMETAKVVDAVRKFRPRNRTTNLNGAVFQGLGALKEQLAPSRPPRKKPARWWCSPTGAIWPTA